jgi:hypothetical protein
MWATVPRWELGGGRFLVLLSELLVGMICLSIYLAADDMSDRLDRRARDIAVVGGDATSAIHYFPRVGEPGQRLTLGSCRRITSSAFRRQQKQGLQVRIEFGLRGGKKKLMRVCGVPCGADGRVTKVRTRGSSAQL